MHCCKVNARLLGRFAPSTGTPSTSSPSPQPSRNYHRPWYRTCPRVRAGLRQRNWADIMRNQQIWNTPEEDKKEEKIVEFPPILELSVEAKRRRRRELWHKTVEKLGTVEEKIFELNMPRYYGWRAWKIDEGNLPYDPLPYVQYITKTHLESQYGLPSYYDSLVKPEALDSFVQQIKSQIEDVLAFEYNCRKSDYQHSQVELEDNVSMKNVRAKAISQQINRILTCNLAPSYIHLMEAQMDLNPRIEAFWFYGGLETPRHIVKSRWKQCWVKDKESPIDHAFVYHGTPVLQLRHNLPLKELISMKESENESLEIPTEPLGPMKEGYFREYQRATIIPGFWPGDHSEFGIVSYHSSGHLTMRPEHFNDFEDATVAQAILGSFAWLYAQACYQGFSTFHDPTYPLVTQSVITNGKWWSFFVYQLNTTALHVHSIKENPRRNICWMSKPMKLFETIKGEQVQGLNEDVLKHLIKFYANVPEVREGVEMKPYLGDEQLIADIKEDERRIWLENRYKHLLSNRPRHRMMPEITHWHKIYKIDNKTRPLDKKREPWEFGINPYKRTLDDHSPEYIPRAFREKRREKRAKSYYPYVHPEDLKL